ncbi:hypothetical protein E2562_039530 [Oryza meyeriana var. granulata]|uniref:Uncharacterized protein n=1 Tax=Oryza meyeriana var. granulata TaxID=110450 RepID=A0A6G1C2W5_9ORYZ|nr:hypothetical protein E2562_039530 [Oryza meyeriana var. granulata]
MRDVLAGDGKGAHMHGAVDAAAVRQLTMKPTRLEDVVAPELGVDLELHRRILAEDVRERVLTANQQGCIKSCPARGFPVAPPDRGCYPLRMPPVRPCAAKPENVGK